MQSDTLLLADVFENFLDTYLEVNELNPGHFLTAPGVAWQGTLQKAKVKLDLLTDIDMFLMVEKRIRWNMPCYLLIYES